MQKTVAKHNLILANVLKTFPRHTEPEHEALSADIKQKGQLVPILMKGKVVVDGRARLQICKELGIKPITYDLGSAANDADWAVSVNLYRRHLTTGQRAIIAEELASLRKGSNQHTAKAACSRKVAAQRMGVSKDSIDRARKVRAGGSSKLVDMVRRGKVSLDAAAHLVKSYPEAHEQDEILVKGIARVTKEMHKKEVLNWKRQEAQKLALNNDAALATLDKTYSVIYADPPWNYGGSFKGSFCDPSVHYPLMSTAAIQALPVKRCLNKDAALYLWVPSCLLEDGLAVLKAWGFSYVSSMVWCKNRPVMSRGPTKTAHEMLLIGKKGGSIHKLDQRLNSWVMTVAKAHSKKPDEFAKMLDAMYPRFSKLEMFARQPRGKHWTVFGNEVVEEIGKAKTEAKTKASKAPLVKPAEPRSKDAKPVTQLELNRAKVLREMFGANDPRSRIAA